jgi:hypothetical protein
MKDVEAPSVQQEDKALPSLYFFFQWLDSPLGAWASSFFEVSRSHILDTPHSVGLLWTRDQPVAEIST